MTQEEKGEEKHKEKDLPSRYRILLYLTVLIGIPVLIAAVVVTIHFWPASKPVEVVPIAQPQPLEAAKPYVSSPAPPALTTTTTKPTSKVRIQDDHYPTQADIVKEAVNRILQEMEVELIDNRSNEESAEEDRNSPSAEAEMSSREHDEIAERAGNGKHADNEQESKKANAKTKVNKTSKPNAPCDCKDKEAGGGVQQDEYEGRQDIPLLLFDGFNAVPGDMEEIAKYVNAELPKIIRDFSFPSLSIFYPEYDTGNFDEVKEARGHKKKPESTFNGPSKVVSEYKKFDEFLEKAFNSAMDKIKNPKLKSAFKEFNDMLGQVDHLENLSLDEIFKMVPKVIVDNIPELKGFPELRNIADMADLLGLGNLPDFLRSFVQDVDLTNLESISGFLQQLGFDDVTRLKDVPGFKYALEPNNNPDFDTGKRAESIDIPRIPK